MHYSRKLIVAGLASVLLAAGATHAKVSEQEAEKLGTKLHPFGAEIATGIQALHLRVAVSQPPLAYDGPQRSVATTCLSRAVVKPIHPIPMTADTVSTRNRFMSRLRRPVCLTLSNE